jgi:SAM-dependent methyltransferase
MGKYVLGTGESERARLMLQGEIHRPEAEHLLDRIGVTGGWRTLDVGCGPLGILDLLAARAGSVTGVDLEPRMLELATISLSERDISGVDLIQADALATGLDSNSFDLTHARFLLINSTKIEDIVAELVRITRPGGIIALQDYDIGSMLVHPPLPAWERLYDLFLKVWVGDSFVGRRLTGLLRGAGIEDIKVDAHTRAWQPGDWYHTLSVYLAEDLLRPRLRSVADESELDSLVAETREHLARPDSLTQHGTLFQAWGRKPSS